MGGSKILNREIRKYELHPSSFSPEANIIVYTQIVRSRICAVTPFDPPLTVQYVIFSDDVKHSSVSEAAALYVNVSTQVLQEGIIPCIHCVCVRACACLYVCACVCVYSCVPDYVRVSMRM